MIKYVMMCFGVCGLGGWLTAGSIPLNSSDALAEGMANLRFHVTRIEVESTNKVVDYAELTKEADLWIATYPDRAEPLVWKGITLAARAKHLRIRALSVVNEARELLERAVKMDPNACDAAGYNALGILYHKVPGWPISFGNNKKAREYFEKAIARSPNLDTYYRFGEFLLDVGEKEEGLRYLKNALAQPVRPNRREDVFKRKMIEALMHAKE